MFSLSGTSASVTDVKLIRYDEILLTLSEPAELNDVTVTVSTEAFTEYSYKLLSGIDGCDRSVQDEASLRGYSETQNYTSPSLESAVHKMKTSGCGNCAN